MKVLLGLGASNCLILLHWDQMGRLGDDEIVIFEPHEKNTNDKTFCFWARPQDECVHVLKPFIEKEWRLVQSEGCLQALDPYRYYKIPSLSLYHGAKALIDRHKNIRWVKEPVYEVRAERDGILVNSEALTLCAERVYDSRPPKWDDKELPLLQTFLGWEVEFTAEQWHPAAMTLMDFEVPQDGATQFIYTLPTTSRKALVEFTRFGTAPIASDRAEQLLHLALKDRGSFRILSRERGTVPMSQTLAVPAADPRIVPMGARAGCIKPSTGYAFLNMYRHAQALASAPEATPVEPPKSASRFAFYDGLLLHILKHKPQWGRPIFKKLFSIRETREVLQFLDERSSLLWELRMFAKLPVFKFLWALGAQFFADDEHAAEDHALKHAPKWSGALPMLAALLVTAMYVLLPSATHSYLIEAPLLALLGVVGIPHGALDVFAAATKYPLVPFVLRYLLQVLLMLGLWWWQPSTALVLFLAYSAWHFGQTDLEHWGIHSGALSWLWGALVLTLLLLPHLAQVRAILAPLGISWLPQNVSPQSVALLLVALFTVSSLFALRYQSRPWLYSLASLALLTQLPLFPSFLLYFVVQHSFTGGLHLKQSEGWTWSKMWRLSLPFTLGAAFIYGFYLYSWAGEALGDGSWTSVFFVVLSAISLPHVRYMSRWYAARSTSQVQEA